MSWLIGIDVGGTFTDFYALNAADGDVKLFKRPSTPANPAEAIVLGLRDMMAGFDIAAGDVTRLSHGTTVATNALIQRRGGKVALITTEGFRDLIEIGRQTRPHMFSLQIDHPEPLVARENRIEITERVLADGSIETPLEDQAIDAAVAHALATGAEAVAVCFLFAFTNPAHEAAVGAALRRASDAVPVSLSSEVQPEFREFERASTTVLNAYLQPVMDRYLGSLESEIAKLLPDLTVGLYQSSGGLMSLETARAFPVRSALSGPAAGVVGAIHSAKQSGRANLITIDLGGTSADVSLIRDYDAGVSFDREVAGFPVRLPMVDIHTVGAGGGSIAWFDRDGLLKVGPISAGADPGPACYGQGGDQPTVTDANLLLGRLSPGGLVGGEMPLDTALARQAFTPIAEQLGFTAERTAHGALGILVANVVRAIRTVSVEKGHDPRDYSLMAFGGAGSLHAGEVARSLGIGEIIVPYAPGILCAQGLIVSDLKEDFVHSARIALDDGFATAIAPVLEDLNQRADIWFQSQTIGAEARTVTLALDMRYVGQNFELPVILDRTNGSGRSGVPSPDELRERFFAVHAQHYGFHNPDDAIEVVNLRLTATGALQHAPAAPKPAGTGSPEPVARRPVYFEPDTAVETPVYDRATLPAGFEIVGPAIFEQLDATTLVHPGDTVRIDAALNILIEVTP
ncbi:MAG TPA: hydantoinase/oxoprolinase family protein [Alphaproteobacteria bacterium]|nr:hydantoinase/oxoprolinase family protein [Alphaproteobacteria bacterium]